MNIQTKITADAPLPEHEPWGDRIAVVFYNRNLDGKPYGATEYHFPKSSRASLNDEAHWYNRDHFAVYNEDGLVSDGPTLNALGKPIETYSERKAKRQARDILAAEMV